MQTSDIIMGSNDNVMYEFVSCNVCHANMSRFCKIQDPRDLLECTIEFKGRGYITTVMALAAWMRPEMARLD